MQLWYILVGGAKSIGKNKQSSRIEYCFAVYNFCENDKPITDHPTFVKKNKTKREFVPCAFYSIQINNRH